MADELKGKGNAAFSAGKYDEAIEHFTKAIEIDPGNHVLYSNRSACQASLRNFDAALTDAEKTVELKPDWPKGYSRLGGALFGLRKWDECIDAYKKGLDLEPSNKLLQDGLKEAEAAKSKPAGGGLFGPEFLSKLAMNPETRGYLNQPDFLQMIQTLSSNPGMMTNYLMDPRFQKAMQVGMGLNMSMPGANGAGFPGGDDEDVEVMSESPKKAEPAPPAAAPKSAPPPKEPEPDSDKQKALKEKEAGNAAYKKKDFETAIAHYNKAIELDDQDISFITNRAAVHFEKGEYDKAIEDCELAVEKGREVHADFKLIAKAMTRHGNCLLKKEQPEEAIKLFNKALTEHRNPDTLDLLRKTEKKVKEMQELAYVDLGLAEKAKEDGNAAFKQADYPKAISFYSEALARGPDNTWPEAYKVYSNRAACYTKLGALPEGEKDADKCISLAPDFAKGYSRKGLVLFMKKEYEKALEVYEQGLQHDPDSQELKDGVMRCQQGIAKFLRGEASEEEMAERRAKAMNDPDVQMILSDPMVSQVLKEIQENPRAANQHLKNPAMAMKLQKLMSAGIIQMK